MAQSTTTAVAPRHDTAISTQHGAVGSAEGDLHDADAVEGLDRDGDPRVASITRPKLAQVT